MLSAIINPIDQEEGATDIGKQGTYPQLVQRLTVEAAPKADLFKQAVKERPPGTLTE